MAKKRRIIEGHTLDQYDKRYGKSGLRKVQKKYADKDETLLDGSNWWLIDETYYELPHNAFGYWWKNLSKAGKVALCVLGVGAVTTGVVVPTVLALNHRLVTKAAEKSGDGENLVNSATFEKQSDGSYKGTITYKDEESKNSVKNITVKVDGVELDISKYRVDISTGTITISADAKVSDSATISIVITKKSQDPVIIHVDSVSLDKNVLTIDENQKEKLSVTVAPSNATDKSVTWSSSNKQIAIVDDKGNVTGIKKGTATITVRSTDGNKEATCEVTVKEPIIHVESISLKNVPTEELDVGDEVTLGYDILPETASDKRVNWTSSNSKVATVENGVVKAVGEGETIINVITIDGEKKASCTILVNPEATLEYLSFTALENNEYSVSLNRSVSIPENTRIVIPSTYEGKPVTEIAEEGFKRTDKITKVIIPYSIKKINERAFEACEELKTVIFNTKNEGTKVTGVETIYSSAFSGCNSLSDTGDGDSFILPQSITNIGNAVFTQTKINKLVIPSSCSNVTGFSGTNKYLNTFYIDNETFAKYSIGTSIYENAATIYVPKGTDMTGSYITGSELNFTKTGEEGKYDTYTKTPTDTKYFTYEIDKENKTAKLTGLTDDGKELSEIIIPSVIDDGGISFKVTTIGNNFMGTAYCEDTTKGVSNTKLTRLVIPSSVESIENGYEDDNEPATFYGAFTNCSALTSIVFENNSQLRSIGKITFVGCNALTGIILPENILSIDESTFYLCKQLEYIKIPFSVKTIKSNAFMNSSIESRNDFKVVISDNSQLESIENSAFSYCYQLKSITLPSSVNSISNSAFYNCTSLSTVHIKSTTPPTLGTEVFDCCSNSLQIYVPDDSVETYKAAENWSKYADKIVAES